MLQAQKITNISTTILNTFDRLNFTAWKWTVGPKFAYFGEGIIKSLLEQRRSRAIGRENFFNKFYNRNGEHFPASYYFTYAGITLWVRKKAPSRFGLSRDLDFAGGVFPCPPIAFEPVFPLYSAHRHRRRGTPSPGWNQGRRRLLYTFENEPFCHTWKPVVTKAHWGGHTSWQDHGVYVENWTNTGTMRKR